MIKLKQFTVIMAISLCFTMTACSNNETEISNSTTDTNIKTSAHNTSEVSDTSTENTVDDNDYNDDEYEITNEIYFSDFILFSGNFLAIQDSLLRI